MKRFIFAAVFMLLLSASIYSQGGCKPEDKERASLIVRQLEEDSSLRRAVAQQSFGDCVRFAWMDEMQRFGVKHVAATLDFVWNDKIEKVEIKEISFLETYYRYDTKIKDAKVLEQIEKSGLKRKLEEAILEGARKHILILIEISKEQYRNGILKKEPKGKITGTLYQTLLDDESLPALSEMPTVEF